MTKHSRADADSEQAELPDHIAAPTPEEAIDVIVRLSRFVRAQGYLSLEDVAGDAGRVVPSHLARNAPGSRRERRDFSAEVT